MPKLKPVSSNLINFDFFGYNAISDGWRIATEQEVATLLGVNVFNDTTLASNPRKIDISASVDPLSMPDDDPLLQSIVYFQAIFGKTHWFGETTGYYFDNDNNQLFSRFFYDNNSLYKAGFNLTSFSTLSSPQPFLVSNGGLTLYSAVSTPTDPNSPDFGEQGVPTPTPVPEPHSLILFSTALLLLSRRMGFTTR
jgi:hypothetical protein